MTERLFAVLRVYGAVLLAIGRFIVGGAIWLVLNLILDTIFGESSTDVGGDGIEWAGALWLIYAIAAAVLAIVLRNHGAPAWQVDLVIVAAVLAVLPIHSGFSWARPRRRRVMTEADPG